MPTRTGINLLGGWLIDFSADHPELQLDIELSNVNQHLVQDEIDLAFRVGPLVDSSAIAVHLWDIPYGLYAHKDLVQALTLNPNAISVEQLKTLPGTITLPAKQWAFMDSSRQAELLSPNAEL
ncbi:LysR substrate-binding domain-containing protein [Ferrimonas aestuarii]|uniref:LysR substrate-binding domain-containing protein n=1 Tax=Ferrimonas aestuarii TaxID=2569539 RepID=A0A4U1BPM6_9GAMM|nr:LysR substrate-binding domain-containing protein [Ferrimonas aestuarii]TKB55502.1 hypothetical protein FCL42_09975 [Ferrimonas aestuarii]